MWYAIVADADYSGRRHCPCITEQPDRAVNVFRREYSAWPGQGNVQAVGPFPTAADASAGWRTAPAIPISTTD
jgi:hypothetical protein